METRPVAALEATAIQEFQATLRGALIRPGDESYDPRAACTTR